MSATATDVSALAPDERTFREHLRLGEYVAGEARGDWRLLSITWPTVMMAVSAAPRTNGPKEFVLKIDGTGYPGQGLTGVLWDPVRNELLALGLRPKGTRAAEVFRDWKECLYAPYDRKALGEHQQWLTEFPGDAWNPTRTVTFFLTKVWKLLNDEDYQGV